MKEISPPAAEPAPAATFEEHPGHPAHVRLRDVMVRDPAFAEPNWTLRQAARTLRSHRVSGLPVVEDGMVVGVLSEKDILRDLDRAAGVGLPRGLLDLLLELDGDEPIARLEPCLRRLAHGRVADAMSRPPITVTPQTTVAQADALLVAHRIKRLPVVEDNRLVGLVTRAELLASLADRGSHLVDPDGPWSRHHRTPPG